MYTSATGANAAGNLKTVWSQKRYTKKCNNHKKISSLPYTNQSICVRYLNLKNMMSMTRIVPPQVIDLCPVPANAGTGIS